MNIRDIEKSLIASLILDPRSSIPKVKGHLLAAYIYDTKLQLVYKKLLQMHDIGQDITMLSVIAELSKGKSEDDSWDMDIIGLIESVPYAMCVDYPVQYIKEDFVRRNTSSKAQKLTQAVEQNMSIAEIESIKRDIDKGLTILNPPATMAALLESAQKDIENNAKGYELTTGINEVDRWTNGFARGKLYITAGDTSHLKTGWSIFTCVHNLQKGIPILYLTYDMASKWVLMRFVMCANRLPGEWLTMPMEHGDKQVELKEKSNAFLKKYGDGTLLSIKGYLTINEIERELAMNRWGIVVIDYIQNAIECKEQTDKWQSPNENMQLKAFLARCKNLAEKYDCCINVVSQFSRPTAFTKDGKPVPRELYNLKGSSYLEQSADVVTILEYPFRTDPAQDINDYRIKVAKNNFGEANKIIEISVMPEIQWFCTREQISMYKDEPHEMMRQW